MSNSDKIVYYMAGVISACILFIGIMAVVGIIRG
jgi:hypothetical protein